MSSSKYSDDEKLANYFDMKEFHLICNYNKPTLWAVMANSYRMLQHTSP